MYGDVEEEKNHLKMSRKNQQSKLKRNEGKIVLVLKRVKKKKTFFVFY